MKMNEPEKATCYRCKTAGKIVEGQPQKQGELGRVIPGALLGCFFCYDL